MLFQVFLGVSLLGMVGVVYLVLNGLLKPRDDGNEHKPGRTPRNDSDMFIYE